MDDSILYRTILNEASELTCICEDNNIPYVFGVLLDGKNENEQKPEMVYSIKNFNFNKYQYYDPVVNKIAAILGFECSKKPFTINVEENMRAVMKEKINNLKSLCVSLKVPMFFMAITENDEFHTEVLTQVHTEVMAGVKMKSGKFFDCFRLYAYGLN